MNFTPADIWEFIMLFSYAGKISKADSIFEEYWLGGQNEKQMKYDLFKKTLQESSYWNELQESDW